MSSELAERLDEERRRRTEAETREENENCLNEEFNFFNEPYDIMMEGGEGGWNPSPHYGFFTLKYFFI